jgi:hypothetical protein
LAIGGVFALVATGFTIAMAGTINLLASRAQAPAARTVPSPAAERESSPVPITVATPTPATDPGKGDSKTVKKDSGRASGAPPGLDTATAAKAEHQPGDRGAQQGSASKSDGAPSSGGKASGGQGASGDDNDDGDEDPKSSPEGDDDDGDGKSDKGHPGNGGKPGNGQGKARQTSDRRAHQGDRQTGKP